MKGVELPCVCVRRFENAEAATNDLFQARENIARFHHCCRGKDELSSSVITSSFQEVSKPKEEGAGTGCFLPKCDGLGTRSTDLTFCADHLSPNKDNTYFIDRQSIARRAKQCEARTLQIKTEMNNVLLLLDDIRADIMVFRAGNCAITMFNVTSVHYPQAMEEQLDSPWIPDLTADSLTASADRLKVCTTRHGSRLCYCRSSIRRQAEWRFVRLTDQDVPWGC